MVSAVEARNAPARTGRTGGRAPRAIATRPPITPAQPSAIAAHSDTVTNVAVRWSACHQGRPPARRMAGTATLGPAAESTHVARTEAAVAAAEGPPGIRVGAGEPSLRNRPDAPVSFSLADLPASW